MKLLLGDEYPDFISALNSERSYGLRINPLKFKGEDDLKAFLDANSGLIGITGKVGWADEGYFYDNECRPGRSPLHEAGAYYIQEPSAMSVVQVLDPKPGERICDLCAAPGGKTTQIAGRMRGRGLLIANEIVGDRSRILAQNVERMGIGNCIVTNEDPVSLSAHFISFFHKVVVDAPCSGEGMFRKDDTAIEEWTPANVRMCSDRQKMILTNAARMVMPGGTLVYSTCTFEPDENENIIGDFLKSNPDWHIEHASLSGIETTGNPEWMNDPDESLRDTIRIWPHKTRGEGHFIAKLMRDGEIMIPPENTITSSADAAAMPGYAKKKKNKNKNSANSGISIESVVSCLEEVIGDVRTVFAEEGTGTAIPAERLMNYGEGIFLLPAPLTEERLKGIKLIRPGLELVQVKKDRCEPAHSLAMFLKKEDVISSVDVSLEDAAGFIGGETINNTSCANTGKSHYTLVCVAGISLGWGKSVNTTIKNHYPKGLRKYLK